MTTTNAPAEANPVTHQNSASSQDDELPAEIERAEHRVEEEAKWDGRASTAGKVLLLLYVLVTGAVAWSTVWGSRTNGKLRAAENALNNLQKEKISADSARKTEVDTQRVREDAANDLKIRTDAVRNEGKENLNQTKAELVREQTKLAEEQRRTADAQREAAAAQLALKKHLEEVAERQNPRHLSSEQREHLLKLLAPAKGEFWIGSITSASDAADFADELASLLIEAGWALKRRNVNPDLNFKGLLIRVHSAENPPRRAGVLQHALKSVGLPTAGDVVEGLDESAVYLIVGSKP